MGNWCTTAEAKTLLQISGSTYDTLLDTLRLIVRNDVINYCQNRFLNQYVFLTASTLTFANGTPSTITDSESGFVDAYFATGMDIYVWGSIKNDGCYETGTVQAASIQLASGLTLLAEAAQLACVTVQQVVFPDALKSIAARMMYAQMNKSAIKGLKSRSLGDFSETYAGEGGYPPALLAELNKWRCTRGR